MKIAENIKRYRQKLGFTQEALARKADVSYNTIIKLETNGIKDPRVSTMGKIAVALNTTIDKIIGSKNNVSS